MFIIGSSSSEYESGGELDRSKIVLGPASTAEKNIQASSLIRWFVVFICLWQSVFTVSETAVGMLLQFFATFFQLLASLTSIPLLIAIAAGIPSSLYLLKKYVESDADCFIKYIVCPSCFSIYKLEHCFFENEFGEKLPKKCSHIQYPMHPQRNRRLPCSTPLLTKVHMSGGKVKYVPRYTYSYQPIKVSLQRMLDRPGFAEQLEQWRRRQSREGFMSDVYDGQVWKDFQSEKYNKFLQNRRCYGLMLNFDFFQPYKHTPESYGVFYMTLINLPREQRFKRENILLVGIIPAFEHEPGNLNPFMQPLVDELQQFWSPGIRLFTAESPKFRLQFRLALMCVACDIPAARKVCGFMGHGANLGCSKCLKFFPGGFDKKKRL